MLKQSKKARPISFLIKFCIEIVLFAFIQINYIFTYLFTFQTDQSRIYILIYIVGDSATVDKYYVLSNPQVRRLPIRVWLVGTLVIRYRATWSGKPS